ncbi:Magnesium transporter [Ascosphaera apis ARSEF 7405]|uniref:Magnesium transporter n=1 Tax=Ascosphaera apis ARSEF 7405 TaxID=392613 RepID=A0A168BB67_9EURO|nr:Magnesium transporter [Ascosphaera apis ARSEF 7405]
MGLFSRATIGFGLLLLAHAGYSVHELSLLYGSAHTIPLDIICETLAAVFITTLGLVLGSEKLKPITWSVWAGNIEEKGGHDNPFRAYEDGLGFWDVRTKRKEFADWVRQKDTLQKAASS